MSNAKEVFAGPCQSCLRKEENVLTLYQSYVMLSGIFETEFRKLTHLWGMVGWKAFTTMKIALLSLFDTFHIFCYLKFCIQLNI